MERFSKALVSTIILLTTACTQPPEVPRLNSDSDLHPIQRIALDDHFTKSDIREIFTALNQKGELDSLKRWLDSDETLDILARVVDRHFYQTAHDHDGWLPILEARTNQKDFSHLHEALQTSLNDSQKAPPIRLLAKFLATPGAALLLQRDISWISERALSLMEQLNHPFPERFTFSEPEVPIEGKSWANDFRAFLNHEKARPAFLKFSRTLESSELYSSVMRALSNLQHQHDGLAAIGLARGLSQLLPEDDSNQKENQLQRLLELVLALDEDTEGLFGALQEGIANRPELFLVRVGLLDEYMLRNLRGAVRFRISPTLNKSFWSKLKASEETQHPTAEFRKVSGQIQSGFESILGVTATPETSRQYVLTNLPILLNGLVLARWFEATVPANLPSLADGEAFSKDFWTKPYVAQDTVTIDLLERDASGKPVGLSERTKRELAEAPSQFIQEVEEHLVGASGVGRFRYVLPKGEPDENLESLLLRVLQAIHDQRPFADSDNFFRNVLFDVSSPEGAGFKLKWLDETRPIEMLNKALIFPTNYSESSALLDWLFNDLQLGNVPEGIRQILEQWLEPSQTLSVESSARLQQKLSFIVDRLGLIPQLDQSIDGLPTPFESYLQVVREHPSTQRAALMQPFHFLSSVNAFSQYPSLIKTIKDPRRAAHVVWSLSRLSSIETEEFGRLMSQSLGFHHGISGAEIHFDFLRHFVGQHESAIGEFLDSIRAKETGPVKFLRKFTSREREWLIRFMSSEEFPALWNLFWLQTSPEDRQALFDAIRTLSDDGRLREALELLSYLRDERVRSAAELLLKMESTGELKALLSTLESVSQQVAK